MSRTRLAGLALVVAALLAGCANIPEQSSPQAVPNGGGNPPGPNTSPDDDADPLTLVRGFVGAAGNPEVAKGYLTPEAREAWQADAPPTIIDETFVTAPLPIQDRRAQGQEQPNEFTVVLTVTKVGRLGSDRAFVPAFGSEEYRVQVRRDNASAPWRIQTPPEPVLISLPDFTASYQQVRVYFFDPEFRVIVPDLRYVLAQPGGVPDRVVRLLLDGPSDTLVNAVKTAIEDGAELRTNAVADTDGALVVNLTKLGDLTPDERDLIAAQIVLTLRDVTQSRIRLMVDGQALVPGHGDWRPSDVPSYDAVAKPNADLPGMFTNTATGRVHSLRNGDPVAGPAGNGDLRVTSAAQSFDGSSIAVVHEVPTGARLRIGPIGQPLAEVDLEASTLTRPTWLFGTPTAASNEVWTVQNGVDVFRVVRTGTGTWSPSKVNAGVLREFGTITDLRLSRDGVRMAAVANGQVVVATVVRARDSVTIQSPRTLQGTRVKDVVGVDWRSQDTVVVATAQTGQLVLNLSVDGFDVKPYTSQNLGTPVSAIAAAPDRDVVVTDRVGMWTSSDTNQVWQLQPQHQIPGARPFYPG
ncbi:MAG TPA: LpqB family beta-propeller domain-containing protein [Actinophytocola sp.]|uniref:LpqB family beta-propeller domain-containing protein n=1 Tax=Actinophytocola sp. TaxID=1872138 RepID=UPI002DDD22B1|nr:LpqB family beta-propeller domain-containing protein [Actinophytocola sp.]HEV2778017.1 LpqB family beta-propeller domain-containing protein [Actinophytocola sp.]